MSRGAAFERSGSEDGEQKGTRWEKKDGVEAEEERGRRGSSGSNGDGGGRGEAGTEQESCLKSSHCLAVMSKHTFPTLSLVPLQIQHGGAFRGSSFFASDKKIKK